MSDYSDNRSNQESSSRDMTIDPRDGEFHIREGLENLVIRAGIVVGVVGATYGVIKLADYYHILGFYLK